MQMFSTLSVLTHAAKLLQFSIAFYCLLGGMRTSMKECEEHKCFFELLLMQHPTCQANTLPGSLSQSGENDFGWRGWKNRLWVCTVYEVWCPLWEIWGCLFDGSQAATVWWHCPFLQLKISGTVLGFCGVHPVLLECSAAVWLID